MSPVQIATEIAGNHSRLMGKLKAVSRDGLHMTLGDGRKLEVAYVGYSLLEVLAALTKHRLQACIGVRGVHDHGRFYGDASLYQRPEVERQGKRQQQTPEVTAVTAEPRARLLKGRCTQPAHCTQAGTCSSTAHGTKHYACAYTSSEPVASTAPPAPAPVPVGKPSPMSSGPPCHSDNTPSGEMIARSYLGAEGSGQNAPRVCRRPQGRGEAI